MKQLKLFYQDIKYANTIDFYIIDHVGTGRYNNGKRLDDVLYYTSQKEGYTISKRTIDKIIAEK